MGSLIIPSAQHQPLFVPLWLLLLAKGEDCQEGHAAMRAGESGRAGEQYGRSVSNGFGIKVLMDSRALQVETLRLASWKSWAFCPPFMSFLQKSTEWLRAKCK